MRTVRTIAFVLMAAQLSGCGGGGVTSTPPPPAPPPVPAPPPPPPPPFPLSATASYQSITGVSTYSISYFAGSPPQPTTVQAPTIEVKGRGDQPVISYSSATGTYSLQSPTLQVSLTSADRVATSDYAHAFSKTSGSVSDQVILYGNAFAPAPAVSPPVALTYSSYGFWRHTDTAANLTTYMSFLYGEPTGSANMPRTGTASFQGTATGLVMEGGPTLPDQYSFAGTATLAADFAANTISTTLNLGGLGTYSGNGTISADQFNGPLTSSYTNFTNGQFAGGFFGPNAAEAGYTFFLRYFNPDPYAGASVSWSNRYFSGVVAAKKN
jgi:C-lobe and N-lobe beta barrels of Tf-binding protein B